MVKNIKAVVNILIMLKDLQDKTSSEKNSEIYIYETEFFIYIYIWNRIFELKVTVWNKDLNGWNQQLIEFCRRKYS